MSSGRTLLFSLSGDHGLPMLPTGGLTDAENEESAATRVVQRGGLAMGPDPEVYAYVKADFQGNLFRIPLH